MPISTISSLAGPHGSASTGSPEAANGPSSSGVDPRSLVHDKMEASMEHIIVRQLNEDIRAYKYDMEFCNSQMKATDVTPQEMRTLQLRVLDLTHSMRHSQHRIEQLQLETTGLGKSLPLAQTTESSFGTFPRPDGPAVKRPGVPLPNAHAKRSRPSTGMDAKPESCQLNPSPAPSNANSIFEDEDDEMQRTLLHGNNSLQRLGYWKCRLCTSQKYANSKHIRQPAAPCKWPLKDVAKMIAHYTELHTEHEPDERCIELGQALDRNRGPFQYWLTRSHSQNLANGSAVDEVVETLYSGRLPDLLRKLSRAAAAFPGGH